MREAVGGRWEKKQDTGWCFCLLRLHDLLSPYSWEEASTPVGPYCEAGLGFARNQDSLKP